MTNLLPHHDRAAILESLKVEVGEWVVEVPIERVVSGISDNAKGAVKVCRPCTITALFTSPEPLILNFVMAGVRFIWSLQKGTVRQLVRRREGQTLSRRTPSMAKVGLPKVCVCVGGCTLLHGRLQMLVCVCV